MKKTLLSVLLLMCLISAAGYSAAKRPDRSNRKVKGVKIGNIGNLVDKSKDPCRRGKVCPE